MSRNFLIVAACLGGVLTSCRPSVSTKRTAAEAADSAARPDASHQTVSPQEQPDTVPPADVSHGEAPIGGPGAEPAPVAARLEPAERTRLHRIRLEISHATILIAPGVR